MRIHRPLTPEEAYGIRKECRASSYLLGGTYVLSIGHEREDLIDLNGFITSGISEEGDSIIIGAGAKLEDVSASSAVPPIIRKAAAGCPSLQQRNMATIGGNAALCLADGYMTAALLAADAHVLLYDGDSTVNMPYRVYAEKHSPEWIILSLSIAGSKDGSVKRISRASHMHAAVTAAVCGDSYAYTASPSSIMYGNRDCYKDMDLDSDLTGSAEYKRYLLSVIFKEDRDGNQS